MSGFLPDKRQELGVRPDQGFPGSHFPPIPAPEHAGTLVIHRPSYFSTINFSLCKNQPSSPVSARMRRETAKAAASHCITHGITLANH